MSGAEVFVDRCRGDPVPAVSKQQCEAARAGEEEVDPGSGAAFEVLADGVTQCLRVGDGLAGAGPSLKGCNSG